MNTGALTFQGLIFEYLKANGLSLVLLAVAVWFFYQENKIQNAKIEQCNERVITILTEVVQSNTDAVKELNSNQREVRDLVESLAITQK